MIALALVAIRAPAAAQLGRWTVAVALGAGAGEQLWSLDRQPIRSAYSFSVDTVALGRSIGPGVQLGIALAYRSSARLELTAEFLYLDAPVRSTCDYVNDSVNGYGLSCAPIIQTSETNPFLGVTGGVRLDLAPRAPFRPYLRAGLGAGSFAVSTVAVEQAPAGIGSPLLSDSGSHKSAMTALFAVGVAEPLDSQRELQLEIRDLMIDFERVTGPGTMGTAPIGRRFAHEAVVTLSMASHVEVRCIASSG